MASTSPSIPGQRPEAIIVPHGPAYRPRATYSLPRPALDTMGIQVFHDRGVSGKDTVHVVHATTDPLRDDRRLYCDV